eukprot:TRINITY_DN4859_c0_g1_i1.p1 TRINITY_DN4859_c0_g1~~TRINITY_DN4859_c0_g1_i1.p1  ORF type:complete len:298 (-),score=55.54 TRINITY_DN4859_c0_g1_i1:65-958(-)
MKVSVLALLFGIIALFAYLKRQRKQKPLSWYKGKRVIITGASGGIGEQLAYKYAQLGAKLCLAARRRLELEVIQENCNRMGASGCIIVQSDVTIEADCKRIIESTVREWAGIDILILNAGAGAIFPFEEVKDLSVFRSNMDINYFGSVYCTHFAFPHLLASKGSIVVVSSLSGKIGAPNRTAYSASKHALHGFFNALRCENGDKIQISIVCPGFVHTDFHGKVNTGGSSFDIARNTSHFMTVEECVEIIFNAERTGKREVVMTLLANIGQYVAPFFPQLIDYFAIKKNPSSKKNKHA